MNEKPFGYLSYTKCLYSLMQAKNNSFSEFRVLNLRN